MMETKSRQKRTAYPTAKQKRKLISLMAQHPQLISFKVTEDFKQRDSQILWNNIAAECNSLPGARKTWRQWRKTWQDIRCKIKRKQQLQSGENSTSVTRLSMEEKDALGLKNDSSNSYQDTEFIAPEDESSVDINLNGYNDSVSFSEPGSPADVKLEVLSRHKPKKSRSKTQDHPENCVFNCDKLAAQEERKLQIKEDYLNFKKDYLRQKLLLIKEQTEALKEIASSLAK